MTLLTRKELTDWIIKWGSFAGSIATAITVIVLVCQTNALNEGVHQQQIQTNILQTQFEEKDRPWIGMIDSPTWGDLQIRSLFNEKGEEKSLEEFNKMTIGEKKNFNATLVQWSITLKNAGQTTAVDIQGRAIVTIGKKPLKTDLGEFLPKFNMMQNEERTFLFTMPTWYSERILVKENESYLSFDFIYGAHYSKQDYRYGITIKMNGGTGYIIQKTWDEKSFSNITSELLDEPTTISNKSH